MGGLLCRQRLSSQTFPDKNVPRPNAFGHTGCSQHSQCPEPEYCWNAGPQGICWQEEPMHSRIHPALLILAFHSLACSEDSSNECVEVDEQLADPSPRVWCGGEFSPPPWNGEEAAKSLAVCLEPQSGGACKLCPRADVVDDVEVKMHEKLAADRPDCALEHWEFGCMRTVENAKMIGHETNYCCYQVAIWGQGCKDDLSD
ncbi:hypothetical protein ENSA5_24200 [Enhygromyxa salina]|uniref:Uncharacterized protein n=1 Tax=Enhygromyxa salina TaxID=215803 RepID=A0A2S9YB51_9BACT|nr:hypothetical protein [Enhygromyxa salina]PRQ02329.1 hypothetical protein ENSA5_24200 [Enhygromyxa salina]